MNFWLCNLPVTGLLTAMPQCSVPGCTAQGSHHFPTDKELSKKWIIAIKRADPLQPQKIWTPGKAARICHKHFSTEDYSTTNKYGK